MRAIGAGTLRMPLGSAPRRPLSGKNIACLGLLVGLMALCGFGNLGMWLSGGSGAAGEPAALEIHVFNSTEAPLRLEMRPRASLPSEPAARTIDLAVDQGMCFSQWRADTLDFTVLLPARSTYLNQELIVRPQQRGNVLLDFGGQGAFLRMPLTYFPEHWNEPQQQQWLTRHPQEKDRYSGDAQHVVLGTVDYGLGESWPERLETEHNEPFLRYKLASEKELLQGLLDSFR